MEEKQNTKERRMEKLSTCAPKNMWPKVCRTEVLGSSELSIKHSSPVTLPVSFSDCMVGD